MALAPSGYGFFYARHGRTAANDQKLFCGCEWDIGLTEEGYAQAKNLMQQLRGYKDKITRICTSPMLRTHQTTEIANAELQVPVIVIDGLKEFNFGTLSGQSERNYMHPILTKSFVSDGESYETFQSRIGAAMNEVLGYGPGSLVIAHGGVWIALTDLIGIRQETDNCVLTEVAPDLTGPRGWAVKPCQQALG